MVLLIDNYDSFTYNLTEYFSRLGEETIVVKNDEINQHSIFEYTFNRLVISPGPNRPSDSGNLMEVLNACIDKYPILGICLGHQAIGEYFGAKLNHAIKPMHGKISEIENNGEGIYKGLAKRFNVCRYHSLILEDIEKTELQISARTDKNECMSIIHPNKPIIGIQFHPEAILTENGIELLSNWLNLTVSNVS